MLYTEHDSWDVVIILDTSMDYTEVGRAMQQFDKMAVTYTDWIWKLSRLLYHGGHLRLIGSPFPIQEQILAGIKDHSQARNIE